jgi:hypothetical protein
MFDIFRTAVALAKEGVKVRLGDIAYYSGTAFPEPAVCFSNSRYFYYDATLIRRFFRVNYYSTSYNSGVTVGQYILNKEFPASAVKAPVPDEDED